MRLLTALLLFSASGRHHDVGMFYFHKTAAFGKSGRVAMFEMPEERIQDIDTMDDWKMAEMKYRLLNETRS